MADSNLHITKLVGASAISMAVLLSGCGQGLEDVAAQPAPSSDAFWTGGPGFPNAAAGHSETWHGDGEPCDVGGPAPVPPMHNLPIATDARLRLQRMGPNSNSPLVLVPQSGFTGFPTQMPLMKVDEDRYESSGPVAISGHDHDVILLRDRGSDSAFCLGLRDATPGAAGDRHGGDVHFGN